MTELEMLKIYREILRSRIADFYDQEIVDINFVRELCTDLGETIGQIYLIENHKRVA